MGFESLLGSTSPIPELCVVAKNEMGTTEDIIQGGKLQMAKVCKADVHQRFSPANARNGSLFFLPSHVSRSVSPTTTSQIQARKKRRGVSPICGDHGGYWEVALVPVVWQSSPGHPPCAGTQRKIDFTPFPALSPAKLSPQPIGRFFLQRLGLKSGRKGWGWGGEERFHLGYPWYFCSAFAPKTLIYVAVFKVPLSTCHLWL